MIERAIIFGCEGEELLGILHDVARDARSPSAERAVLVIVGGPQYRVGSHRQFVLMARHLADAGYPVLRFDYRGMGDSGGETRTFEQAGPDVRAALDIMFRELPGLRSVCIFGLCDAASAALMFGAPDPRVDALVLANPWVRTDAGQAKAIVQHYYGKRLFEKSFWAKLLSGGLNPVAALSGLLRQWRQSRNARPLEQGFIARMLDGLAAFRGPVLLLLSARDLTAREFEDLCRSDTAWRDAMEAACVKRVNLVDTDHTFSDESGLMAANAATRGFLDSHYRGK